MPSPFDRLLKQLSEQAQQDPAAAFAEIDQLFNKSANEDEVIKACAFASNLGGAALGKLDETIAFLKRLLEHPAVNYAESAARRSIQRALSVMYLCAGDEEQAREHQELGVQNASEHCRYATTAANTLIARQKFQPAIAHLKHAAALSQELSADDEVLKQVAGVGANISRLAEHQLRIAQDLLLSSTYAAKEAWLRDGDWRTQHKALYLYARALLKCGKPTQGLDIVQQMMKLERENKAGPLEQFYSAATACRGQTIRGQTKVAAQALAACEALAKQVPAAEQEAVGKLLTKISKNLEKERERVKR